MDSKRATSLGPIVAAVCNYNGREHLRPCLAALAAQTRPLDAILVVDNASTDDSREIVAREFPAARLVPLAENGGPCTARNRGMQEAGAAWVLLVDNDAVLAPDAVEKLERAALAHPEGSVFAPRSVVASDPTVVHYDGGGLHYCGLFSLRNFYAPLASAEGRGTLEIGGSAAVAMLVDKRALLELGGFDASYFYLFEDLDMAWRLRLAGKRAFAVEDALCAHRGGTPGLSFRGAIDYPARRAELHSLNRWRLILKCHSLATLVLAAPALVAYEVVWALFTLGSGNFGPYVRGKLRLVGELGRISKQRAEVQRSRVRRDREILVGGPLTVSPQLRRGGLAGGVLRALDVGLGVWWKLIRPVC